MTRPLLLLDVDGVLNPFGAVRCPSGFAEHDLFPDEEPVRVNPGHGAWITELGDVYDVAWATFWNENANRLLVPLLGIAPLPILTMPSAPCHPSAKVPLIAEFCRDRPAVWIDDAHTPEALTWSGNRIEPTLLIAIDLATGLTRRSVDQTLTWSTACDPVLVFRGVTSQRASSMSWVSQPRPVSRLSLPPSLQP